MQRLQRSGQHCKKANSVEGQVKVLMSAVQICMQVTG